MRTSTKPECLRKLVEFSGSVVGCAQSVVAFNGDYNLLTRLQSIRLMVTLCEQTKRNRTAGVSTQRSGRIWRKGRCLARWQHTP